MTAVFGRHVWAVFEFQAPEIESPERPLFELYCFHGVVWFWS
jgi:hypothetical protein